MGFSLIPREMKFFDRFDEATAVLCRASGKLVELVTAFDRLDERGTDLKQEETLCDQIVERTLADLDRSFITPFDREDIHTLTGDLDDVMDAIEETAYRFCRFRVDRPTPAAVRMAQIVQQCCGHLQQAIALLRDLGNAEQIQGHLREVSRLENEADTTYRDSDSALFADGAGDILGLIKWRELYGWLEETVDACKDVANVVAEIVIKGS
jgi:uncharacterized protein Yka (UPF0111/DUF47 family)